MFTFSDFVFSIIFIEYYCLLGVEWYRAVVYRKQFLKRFLQFRFNHTFYLII